MITTWQALFEPEDLEHDDPWHDVPLDNKEHQNYWNSLRGSDDYAVQVGLIRKHEAEESKHAPWRNGPRFVGDYTMDPKSPLSFPASRYDEEESSVRVADPSHPYYGRTGEIIEQDESPGHHGLVVDFHGRPSAPAKSFFHPHQLRTLDSELFPKPEELDEFHTAAKQPDWLTRRRKQQDDIEAKRIQKLKDEMCGPCGGFGKIYDKDKKDMVKCEGCDGSGVALPEDHQPQLPGVDAPKGPSKPTVQQQIAERYRFHKERGLEGSELLGQALKDVGIPLSTEESGQMRFPLGNVAVEDGTLVDPDDEAEEPGEIKYSSSHERPLSGTFYHGTSKSGADDISQNGIRAGLFLAKDPQKAKQYASAHARRDGTPARLVQVEVNATKHAYPQPRPRDYYENMSNALEDLQSKGADYWDVNDRNRPPVGGPGTLIYLVNPDCATVTDIFPASRKIAESSNKASSDDDGFGGRLGRCYELAGRHAMDSLFSGSDPDAKLVHGTIQNFGYSPLAHAWVEHSDGTCYEPTTAETWPKDIFNAFFNPVAERTYNRKDFSDMISKHGHWGPWHKTKGRI